MCQRLDDAEREHRSGEPGEHRREAGPLAEPHDDDGDRDGRDDHDAQLELDRAERVERSHRSLVSSA